ncbi:MAG: phage tail tape measure protein [Enterobacteriaceae bacterium]
MGDLNRSIKIVIDASGAPQKISELKNGIASLENELASLNGSEADFEERSAKLKKEIEGKYKAIRHYEEGIKSTDKVLRNLSGSTYEELRKQRTKLMAQLKKMTRDSEEYKVTQKQLIQVENEMKVALKGKESLFQKITAASQKYWAMAAGAVVTIMQLRQWIQGLTQDYTQLDKAQKSLQSLTGLDNGAIQWLTNEANKMATSVDESGVRITQSAKEILEAFTVVGSAKPELLQNKEALKEVTKQALILAKASDMDLADAVKGVTLAMNQYSAEADEAARYTNVLAAGSKYGAATVQMQTESILRSGVAASEADISIEQLSGTIETLAEKGIVGEVAGTALRKFFLVLQTGADETNPKIVGYAQALKNLSEQGLTAADVKTKFGEEAYNVATVLINSADKVEYYTQAVTDTAVATEQAAINSESWESKLDQANNRVMVARMSLAEMFVPAMTAAANTSAFFMEVLSKTPRWLNENKIMIIALGVALLAYKVALVGVSNMYAVFLTRIGSLVHGFRIATAAIKTLTAAMASNPWGIILATITLVIGALVQYATKTNHAKEASKELFKEMIKETSELNKLFNALKKAGDGTDQRKRLIEEINTKYGEYLPNLLNEHSSLKDIEQAYKDINTAMRANLAQKILAQKTEEIETEFLDKKSKQMEDIRKALSDTKLPESEIAKATQDIVRLVDKGLAAGLSNEKTGLDVYKLIKQNFFGNKDNATGDLWNEMQDYINVVYKAAKKVKEVEKTLSPFMGSKEKKHSGGYQSKDVEIIGQKKDGGVLDQATKTTVAKEKDQNDELTRLRAKLYDDLKSLQADFIYTMASEEDKALMQIAKKYEQSAEALKNALDKKLISQKEYNDEMAKINAMHAEEEAGLVEKLASKAVDQLSESGNSDDKKYSQDVFRIKQNLLAGDLQAEYELEMSELKKLHDAKLMSDEEYEKAAQQIRLRYAIKRVERAQAVISELSNVSQSLQDSEIAQLDARREKELAAAGDDAEKKKAIDEKYENDKLEIQKKYADVNFAIKVAEITANTAVGIMKAIADLGPIAGPIAAGLIGVNGAVQIAIAAKERQRVKSMTLSGSSSSGSGGERVVSEFFDGGYTGDVGTTEVAGVTHGREYVIPAWQLQQPAVMDMVRIIEAQRRTRTSANPLPNNTPGYADGGYVSSGSNYSAKIEKMLDDNSKLLTTLIRDGVRSNVLLSEFDRQQQRLQKSRDNFKRK